MSRNNRNTESKNQERSKYYCDDEKKEPERQSRSVEGSNRVRESSGDGVVDRWEHEVVIRRRVSYHNGKALLPRQQNVGEHKTLTSFFYLKNF